MSTRSCLDGYLTDDCRNCPHWQDGDVKTGFTTYIRGCTAPYPIMLCSAFEKQFTKDQKETK